MNDVNEYCKKILKKCAQSVEYFIENFCKVEHPEAGLIDFKLFKYQRSALEIYKNHIYCIYKKTRQAGVSTLTGAYALWYAMFHTYKKVLIVSKRDNDAKEFLRKNVKVVFDNLPDWMKSIFYTSELAWNEHTVEFTSGSSIKSLTSAPDTLRSNSASLVILDEAAFMPHMDLMWTAGQPTLMHGGKVIVISTTNGVGNWYWAKWMDAQAKQNDFATIEINWWDMDWEITLSDGRKIAPTAGLRKCTTSEDIDKYGPFWSPWLEQQYRALQQKGETSKFKQEVLAEFLGSGDTVLDAAVLRYIGEFQRANPKQYYIAEPHQFTDQDGVITELDFEKKLWIWEEPKKDHTYVIGLDLSGGEAKDHTAIVVWDLTDREQVAELTLKVRLKIAVRMATWISMWYNYGVLVVDRSGGLGIAAAQELEHDIGYFNLWRKKSKPSDVGEVGFTITPTSKTVINAALKDNIGMDGFKVHSPRLYKQLMIYINKGGGRTGNESGAGNRDDIVLAGGLGFLAINDATQNNTGLLIPFRANNLAPKLSSPNEISKDNRLLLPVGSNKNENSKQEDRRNNIASELNRFTSQLVKNARRAGETEDQWRSRIKEMMPATKAKNEHFKKPMKITIKKKP